MGAAWKFEEKKAVSMTNLGEQRHWSWFKTRRLCSRLSQRNLVVLADDGTLQLTPRGVLRAVEFVRDHRLLERYMMERAAAQVNQADREADYLEHGLMPEHLIELSSALLDEVPQPLPNPHRLDGQ